MNFGGRPILAGKRKKEREIATSDKNWQAVVVPKPVLEKTKIRGWLIWCSDDVGQACYKQHGTEGRDGIHPCNHGPVLELGSKIVRDEKWNPFGQGLQAMLL